MLGHINNIWRKELMDGIRDRRAIGQSLLIPLSQLPLALFHLQLQSLSRTSPTLLGYLKWINI